MEKNNDIMYLRMITGEDIIAEIETIKGDNDNFFLHNPLKLVYMPNPKSPGMWSISMMQWIFNKITKEQKFIVSMRDILTMAEPSPYVIGYYHETVAHFTAKKTDQNNMDSLMSELERIAKELFNKDDVQEEEEPEVSEEMEKEAEDFVKSFFENMSSNNRGTLH